VAGARAPVADAGREALLGSCFLGSQPCCPHGPSVLPILPEVILVTGGAQSLRAGQRWSCDHGYQKWLLPIVWASEPWGPVGVNDLEENPGLPFGTGTAAAWADTAPARPLSLGLQDPAFLGLVGWPSSSLRSPCLLTTEEGQEFA
jgi:hypothetical protein